ncbi:GNAT family N-acetyltransferase [Akkermansiaceae bacterium]|nr:GNAT family N-acetyltransferase [Akkermansiaceae bacterium]MDB4537514.1 GNAT family N-acetyltransferase [Akkermansiaceae bacterium]
MLFSPIKYDSPHYELELSLRDEVLRKPLGLRIEDDDLSLEPDQWHFGLFDKKELIACVIAIPHSPKRAQVRQMAVAHQRQKTGCGREIMLSLEDYLISKGVEEIFLHARVQVAGFYQKLGYHPIGEIFTEVGIPHQKMRKSTGDQVLKSRD